MSFRPVNVPPSQATARDDNSNTTPSAPAFRHNPPQVHSQDLLGPPGSYPLQKQSSSNSDSQATILSSDSTESNAAVFTPINGTATNNGTISSGQGSSQESQLLQLSQLAAAREKMPDVASRSMKRNADGTIKDPAASPNASPGRHSGHSRNVSGVSVTSTASSRVTDLSSELKTRLSYAMLKINHGWQSRTIDEVENLASSSGSPASSNSTIPGAARSSASPQIHPSHRPTPLQVNSTTSQSQAAGGVWRTSPVSPENPPLAPPPPSNGPSLAPPVSIQPHHTDTNARRNSNPKYTPVFLSPRPRFDGPHPPALPSMNVSPGNRNLRIAADPMVVSPTHDNREKDAMEALLFMSSPGNSANLKNHFPNGPQSIVSRRNGASAVPSMQRTALPTSAPKRKSLPNGRPTPSSQPIPAAHSPRKRVGFGKSPSAPSEMDVDDPTSPRRHATYARPTAPVARKFNGMVGDSASHEKYTMAPPSGPNRGHRPRPRLSIENLDEVLDRVAAETSSSDSEGEIELPGRREGSGMRA